MWSYIWPIGLVILSNTVYQICAKKAPEGMNPFAMLTIVYLVSAAFSFVLFFVLNKGGNLIAVGALLFHEAVTWNKIVGIAICVVGLVFVNLK